VVQKGFHAKTSSVDNSPDEIRDLVLETAERLRNDEWRAEGRPSNYQDEFWFVYQAYAMVDDDGLPLHGEVCALVGAKYLEGGELI